MVGLVHSPPHKPSLPNLVTSSPSDLSTSTSYTTASCTYCDNLDTDLMVECDLCHSWTHFLCTGFGNLTIISNPVFNRLEYTCPICRPSSKSSPNPSNTTQPDSSIPTKISCNSDLLSSNKNAVTVSVCSPPLSSNNPASDPSPPSTSNASSLPSVNNESTTSKKQPRHLLHPLKLQPTSTSLVLSDSQLRRVSKYGLDGSGSTQLYSLSGGKISDLTNALNALYNSSLSSRRDKVTDVFIFIGGNDLSSGTPLPSVEADMNKLIGCLSLVLPKAEQHFLPFLPRPDTKPDLVSAANSMLKVTCGHHFIDLPLLTATSKFFKADDVHLNPTGISVVCSAISKTLNVTGSRGTQLLIPNHQELTSLPVRRSIIATPSNLPPVLMNNSPSFAKVVAAKPSKISVQSSHRSILANKSTAPNIKSSGSPGSDRPSLLPTPPLLPIPQPAQAIPSINSPNAFFTTNPLNSNTLVHPPGLHTILINHVYQRALQQIVTTVQSQLPEIISQLLSNNRIMC